MRSTVIIALVLLVWPALGFAQGELSIEELVDAAVVALKETSYEARMHFIAHYAGGDEQLVHVQHIAPDLYRVSPLRMSPHGEWEKLGHYFIENATRLVQVYEHGGKPDSTIEMPERSFYINDALTVKFLRDLAQHEGTVRLEGFLNELPVIILRQLAFKEKPYTITVGLDTGNHFPLYMLVNDSTHERVVFYEMTSIEYLQPGEFSDSVFEIPIVSEANAVASPEANAISPDFFSISDLDALDSPAQVTVQRSASTTGDAVIEEAEYALPLYPSWLPPGYQVEGIQLLDFYINKADGSEPTVVFHLLVYEPASGKALSVFEANTTDSAVTTDVFGADESLGYIVEQRGDWLVAVFGDLPPQTLLRLIDSLEQNDTVVRALLELTQSRDRIIQQAIGE